MPSTIIDFHVHAFPDAAQSIAGRLPAPLRQRLNQLPLEMLRRRGRIWTRTISHTFHSAQTYLRHLPDPIRDGLDEIVGLAPLPNLLFESTVRDLLEEMEINEVDRALLVADPDWSPNDFVLNASQADSRLMAAVGVPPGDPAAVRLLEQLSERGARALRINPTTDHEEPDSPRYRTLIGAAAELGLPVILHTGTAHPHLFLKAQASSDAGRFSAWFADFPKARFVLAHMNGHQPEAAIDLALEHPNVYVDTSWQPAEVIGEAVRRMGAERILFATDWPILGDNLAVGLARVQDAVSTDLITPDQARLILGENAKILLGL